MPPPAAEEDLKDAERDASGLIETIVSAPKMIQEFMAIAVVGIVLVLLFQYRQYVLILLCGDGTFNLTTASLCWVTCCTCCGACQHNWTRWLTCCCPGRYRNANLIKALAADAGIATQTVEISNLVAGDLPFQGRGHFYISLTCQSHPEMTTALAEDKPAKLVHFPEVFTIRLRDSFLEENVKIKVCELNVLGHQSLCEMSVSAVNMISWMQDGPYQVQDMSGQTISTRTRRFKMKTLDPTYEANYALTPPWISFDVTEPVHDTRRLDQFDGEMSTVRTSTLNRNDERSTRASIAGQKFFQDLSMTSFKGKYKLLDTGGNHVTEPEESELVYLQGISWCSTCLFKVLFVFSLLALLVLDSTKLYTNSCYQYYEDIVVINEMDPTHRTMLGVNAETPFPVSTAELITVRGWCRRKVKGTGWNPGEVMAKPCLPDPKKVMEQCDLPPPEGQPPAKAFVAEAKLYLEFIPSLQKGFGCVKEACQIKQTLQPYLAAANILCFVLLFVSVCLSRPITNTCVAKYRRSQVNAKRGEAFTKGSLHG